MQFYTGRGTKAAWKLVITPMLMNDKKDVFLKAGKKIHEWTFSEANRYSELKPLTAKNDDTFTEKFMTY